MKKKPEATYFESSLNQLSQMTGFGYRTIKKKLEVAKLSPIRKKGRAYLFDTPLALKALYFSLDGESKKLDYTQERAKHVRQQRKKVKIERLRLQKILVDTTEVKSAYKNLVLGFRAKMLAIPTKLANMILNCETKIEAEQVIRKEVENALIELVTDETFIDDVVVDE